MPWIAEFTQGEAALDRCSTCGVKRHFPQGDMRALLEPIGTQWPDLIGEGSLVGLFVASGRFIDALRSCGVRVELGGRVEFDEPGPKRLSLADAPTYYWVDGEQHLAAKMDFKASGFVGVKHCEACGERSHDIKASRRNEELYVFDYEAISGLGLFSTDMNPDVFFCTERVLECCREHRPTNVAIKPVEEGWRAKSIKFW